MSEKNNLKISNLFFLIVESIIIVVVRFLSSVIFTIYSTIASTYFTLNNAYIYFLFLVSSFVE